MAFELLRTDYVDATFEGLRRYLVSENGDGSVSFHDITNYTVKEGSFFGAKDANTINTAVNAILAALENGTDLYEVFTQFFELQKTLFLEESDAKQEGFEEYITQLRSYMDGKWDELKEEYTGDIQYFKDVQENAFNVWFQMVRDQLTNDVAGHLQTQIGNLNNLEIDAKGDLVSAINSLCMTYEETMEILAGVKTVTLTLSANDGASVEGQTVTLHNMVTGEDTVMVYSGDGISFEVYGDIEYILTVNVLENHVTPKQTEICITEGDTLELNLGYDLKPLDDLPWSLIVSLSESGMAGKLFNLHDTKEVELTTGEKIEVEIVGFNHDILASDETKMAGITFCMKDCMAQTYRMNQTNTNVGGWKESEMRTVHVREHFYDVLPDDLKEGIKQVNKKTSTGNKGTTVETTADDVWLFSLLEMGVKSLGAPYSQEGNAYPAFNSEASRVKHKGKGGTTIYYWLRSAYAGNTTYFKQVSSSGNASAGSYNGSANSTSYGMAVGFCI